MPKSWMVNAKTLVYAFQHDLRSLFIPLCWCNSRMAGWIPKHDCHVPLQCCLVPMIWPVACVMAYLNSLILSGSNVPSRPTPTYTPEHATIKAGSHALGCWVRTFRIKAVVAPDARGKIAV